MPTVIKSSLGVLDRNKPVVAKCQINHVGDIWQWVVAFSRWHVAWWRRMTVPASLTCSTWPPIFQQLLLNPAQTSQGFGGGICHGQRRVMNKCNNDSPRGLTKIHLTAPLPLVCICSTVAPQTHSLSLPIFLFDVLDAMRVLNCRQRVRFTGVTNSISQKRILARSC